LVDSINNKNMEVVTKQTNLLKCQQQYLTSKLNKETHEDAHVVACGYIYNKSLFTIDFVTIQHAPEASTLSIAKMNNGLPEIPIE
jgi:hypothetical protein